MIKPIYMLRMMFLDGQNNGSETWNLSLFEFARKAFFLAIPRSSLLQTSCTMGLAFTFRELQHTCTVASRQSTIFELWEAWNDSDMIWMCLTEWTSRVPRVFCLRIKFISLALPVSDHSDRFHPGGQMKFLCKSFVIRFHYESLLTRNSI